jgi:hypothetical protein
MVIVSFIVYGLVLIGQALGERFFPLRSAFAEEATTGGGSPGL